jgi:hypothetical protein
MGVIDGPKTGSERCLDSTAALEGLTMVQRLSWLSLTLKAANLNPGGDGGRPCVQSAFSKFFVTIKKNKKIPTGSGAQCP